VKAGRRSCRLAVAGARRVACLAGAGFVRPGTTKARRVARGHLRRHMPPFLTADRSAPDPPTSTVAIPLEDQVF
jgi:hypothetical protein